MPHLIAIGGSLVYRERFIHARFVQALVNKKVCSAVQKHSVLVDYIKDKAHPDFPCLTIHFADGHIPAEADKQQIDMLMLLAYDEQNQHAERLKAKPPVEAAVHERRLFSSFEAVHSERATLPELPSLPSAEEQASDLAVSGTSGTPSEQAIVSLDSIPHSSLLAPLPPEVPAPANEPAPESHR